MGDIYIHYILYYVGIKAFEKQKEKNGYGVHDNSECDYRILQVCIHIYIYI